MRSFFSRWNILFVVCVLISASVFHACHSAPKETTQFIPGVHAAGVLIGVDDSNAVAAKLGPPEISHPLPGSGQLWLYPSRGMGLQFGGLNSVYRTPLDNDSTVAQIMLLAPQSVDSTKVSLCTLQTPDGISMLSLPQDFLRILGQPALMQAAVGIALDDEFSGALMYPGLYVSFVHGKAKELVLRAYPRTDSAIFNRVIDQPIVPGKSLGGISLGMSPADVVKILGPTNFKEKKIQAEFWFYPQYALKVQFGIPPAEGKRSMHYLDTTYIDHVTGITGIDRTFIDNEVTGVAYKGKTADGFGIGQPLSPVIKKFGTPFHFASKEEATTNGLTLFFPGGSSEIATGLSGRFQVYMYDGIIFFEDRSEQSINHILVTDIKLPIEESR